VLVSTPFAVAVAYALARFDFPGKTLFDAAVHLPLVLPPVVVGYALLLLLGKRGPIGSLLDDWFGVVVAFRWTGAALAAAIMGFPLMVRAVRLSFEAIDRKLEAAASTLGAGRAGVLLTVIAARAAPVSSLACCCPSRAALASSARPLLSSPTSPARRARCR
jgi:molybdate transport system permease protein